MTTSNSTNFTMTRDQIISSAMRKLGVLGFSQAPSADEVTEHTLALNMMVKSWQADGLNLWTKSTGRIFLQENKSTYNLNSSTGDVASGVPVVETRLSSAVSASNTVIPVLSTVGIISGNLIVIEQSDGTILSTSVVSTTTSTITLTNALTASAISNARVSAFTAMMDRPLEIRNMTYNNSSGIERHVEMINEDEYRLITNKTQVGTVTQAYYDPQLGTGIIRIWMVPTDSTGVLEVDYTRVINDFDASTDTPDLPVEWLQPIVFNLAMIIAPNYGKGDDVTQTIGPMAQSFYQNLLSWDNEKNSFMIIEDTDARG